MRSFPFLALLCADIQLEDPLDHLDPQRRCMHHFTHPEFTPHCDVDQSGLIRYFNHRVQATDDPCTWNGVHCTAGVIDSIKINMGRQMLAVVDMDWLPPTVHAFSYYAAAIAHEWTAAMLPREMRFFYMHNCLVDPSERKTQPLDLEKFPRQMEELHLINMKFPGKIYNFDLPETMRFVFIASRTIQKAAVHFEGLSDSLLSMIITSLPQNRSTVKIVGLSAVQKNRRVTNKESKKSRNEPGYSHYDPMLPQGGRELMERTRTREMRFFDE